MNFMIKLMCFALLCGYIACRPINEEVVDYRDDQDGMTIEELCAQYPNGITLPNLMLSCVRGRNFNDDLGVSLDEKVEVVIKKMLDEIDSIEKAHGDLIYEVLQIFFFI